MIIAGITCAGMSLPNQLPDPSPNDDRRRFQRVKIDILGRYMLSDRREFPCQVTDMSPGGMSLIAPVCGSLGERIIAYVDHLGRLEGHVTRLLDDGFAMSIMATPRKRDKLAAQLTWLANRHVLNLPEDRRHGRSVPANARSTLMMPNGVALPCRIIDISLSGAAISAEKRPPVGSVVVLGKTQGRVVRHIENGFAIEFTRLQHPEFLEENVVAPPS